MPTVDCGHWNGRRNRLPHLAGSIVWRSRWGRRFRLPVEADFHRHPIPKTVMHAPARMARSAGGDYKARPDADFEDLVGFAPILALRLRNGRSTRKYEVVPKVVVAATAPANWNTRGRDPRTFTAAVPPNP